MGALGEHVGEGCASAFGDVYEFGEAAEEWDELPMGIHTTRIVGIGDGTI